MSDTLALSPTVEKFLPRADVLSMVGLKSATTLYDLIRRHDFPEPYAITIGRKGWALSEVQQWIAERKRNQAA